MCFCRIFQLAWRAFPSNGSQSSSWTRQLRLYWTKIWNPYAESHWRTPPALQWRSMDESWTKATLSIRKSTDFLWGGSAEQWTTQISALESTVQNTNTCGPSIRTQWWTTTKPRQHWGLPHACCWATSLVHAHAAANLEETCSPPTVGPKRDSKIHQHTLRKNQFQPWPVKKKHCAYCSSA